MWTTATLTPFRIAKALQTTELGGAHFIVTAIHFRQAYVGIYCRLFHYEKHGTKLKDDSMVIFFLLLKFMETQKLFGTRIQNHSGNLGYF